MIARLAILADRELKRQEVAQLVREEMLAKYEAIEPGSGVGSFPEQRCLWHSHAPKSAQA